MASAAIQFLTVPPVRDVAEQDLLPAARDWFTGTYGEPTPAQRSAWPAILSGQHLLLSSPTGSGKTLAAFMPILSQLLAKPSPGLRCLYVAPLKALCRDVRANLKHAWRSLRETGAFPNAELAIGLRTGDTSWRVRERQRTDPPAILLTTPESLAQLLTHPTAGEMFANLGWVIVDEIHALVGSKRGADLSISLERLEAIRSPVGPTFLPNEPSGRRAILPHTIQRIGLSATCTPLPMVAEFLVGAERNCAIASVADTTLKQFVIEPLFESLDYSLGWMSVLLTRLDRDLAANRTTLIFTNTRNLAERLTWALRRRFPGRDHEIAVHHSALSAARRRSVERRLKQGRLWTVVSSTSLELGIDIGSVDLVVFVHPPGAVVRLLQRVGRSGHRPDEPRRGLLLTASPSELLEAAVTVGSGHDGQIEPVRIAACALDVLCQQLAGIAMTGLASPLATFHLVRRAAPYRDLAWDDFQQCLDYLSGQRRDGSTWLPARLRWDGDTFTIADPRTAKLLRRNLGTILTEDSCAIRLRDSPDEAASPKALGEVDLIYAERLQLGDRFVLDGRCLELKKRESAALIVTEAFGRPQIPRWIGSGVPMASELARRIFVFRFQAGETLREGEPAFRDWLEHDYHLHEPAITALARHIEEQETVSEIPSLGALVIECIATQSYTEYFLHTPLPRAVNETMARVLLHRWNRRNKKNTLAFAADLGMYVMTFETTPIAPDLWRALFAAARFSEDFQDHLHQGSLLQQHFARVAQTGLMVLRHPAGRKRKVGGRDWTERRLFEQLRARCPDFLLLRQAEIEAVTTTCDLAAASAYVESLASMPIRLRTLAQPSAFGESLLKAGGPAIPFGNEPTGEPSKSQ